MSLAFVRGIHRWLVNSPHTWPVMRKMFPFDDIIMETLATLLAFCEGNPPLLVDSPHKRPVIQSLIYFSVIWDTMALM